MGKGIASIGTHLVRGESADSLSEWIKIKEVPDLIGEPDLLETTDLTDSQQTNTLGVQSADLLTFTFNRTKELVDKVAKTANTDAWYGVVFPEGDGYVWNGQHILTQPGFGVNEVIDATVGISNNTALEYKDSITFTPLSEV